MKLTREQFRAFLLERIDQLDRLYESCDPHLVVESAAVYAAAAHAAGDMAAKLGLADLHKASLEFQGMAEAPAVKTFLSSCLAACQPSEAPAEMLTIAEAARILGISTSGLRKLVSRSAIRFAQSAKHAPIRFRREWLDEFIDGKAGNTAEVKGRKERKSKAARARVESQFGFDPGLLNL